jgi:hypothetical protein
MKRTYKPNLKGFITFPRSVILLLKNTDITITEFGYFLLFLTQLDYDPRHNDIYTVLLRDDKQLATVFNCDESTIYRKRTDLIKRGLLQTDSDGNTRCNLLPLFLSKNSTILTHLTDEQLKQIFAVSTDTPHEIQTKIAEMQFESQDYPVTTKQHDSKSTFSSKYDLCSFNKCIEQKLDESIKPEDIPF